MSDTFTAQTLLCYGRDNDIIDELEPTALNRIMYDPASEAWFIGEWDDDE